MCYNGSKIVTTSDHDAERKNLETIANPAFHTLRDNGVIDAGGGNEMDIPAVEAALENLSATAHGVSPLLTEYFSYRCPACQAHTLKLTFCGYWD